MAARRAPDFEAIYSGACSRKGGEQALENLLSRPKSQRALRAVKDDRYLAEFSKKIFQSGFVWRVVEQKWQGFEEVFWSFDIDKLLMMPDDMLERKAQNPAIIRNFRKVKTIRENAAMIASLRRQEDTSFARFVADWPTDNIVGLWQLLKTRGSRLGGNTGPYALRAMGVDTFLMSRDVEGFLRLHDVLDSGVTSKRALTASQDFFNSLRAESGRSLTELSQLVSFNFGENRVGVVVR